MATTPSSKIQPWKGQWPAAIQDNTSATGVEGTRHGFPKGREIIHDGNGGDPSAPWCEKPENLGFKVAKEWLPKQ